MPRQHDYTTSGASAQGGITMWLEPTASGKYKACERFIDPLTGKTRKASITIDRDTKQTRKAAEEALRAKIEAMSEPEMDDITFSQLVDAYRADQEVTVTQSTYRRNYFAMEAVKKMIGGDVLVSRITASYIRKQFTKSGKKPATLNEHLKRLKAVLRWGYKNDLVEDASYLDKLTPFKAPPHKVTIRDKYLESGELRAVLTAMHIDTWRLLTEFLALSGLRIGEAIALKKSDVDLEVRQIHVTKAYDSVNRKVSNAKTMCSIRDVYIQPELEVVIRKIKKAMQEQALKSGKRPDLFLFDQDGHHINYYTYNKYLREKTEAVIGRALTPHALRHTHASLLMEQGLTIDAISRRLGHENSKITKEIYLHVTEKLREKDNAELQKMRLL